MQRHKVININILDNGSAPIDTSDDPIKGPVADKNNDHYFLLLGFSYNWR